MTAEIGILNKTAVVLAADSAVTIGQGRKVYNTATKIFQVGNKPIGIMIFNLSTWMGIPLEIIISQFSLSIQNRPFSELTDYQTSFINFLHQFAKKNIKKDSILEEIKSRLFTIQQNLLAVCVDTFEEKLNAGKASKPTSDEDYRNSISEDLSTLIDGLDTIDTSKHKYLQEFITYKLETFEKSYDKVLKEILDGWVKSEKLKLSDATKKKVIKILWQELIYEIDEAEDFTGIVIAGYGDDEIFPGIIEIRLAEYIQPLIRWQLAKTGKVTFKNKGIIAPFAQRDMIETFVEGVGQDLFQNLFEEVGKGYEKIGKKIQSYRINKTKKEEFAKLLRDIMSETIKNSRSLINKSHVSPLMQTISHLGNEGLAEIAESLVSITALKRKTNNDIATVGGPIDVAIITKTSGFTWIKRKVTF